MYRDFKNAILVGRDDLGRVVILFEDDQGYAIDEGSALKLAEALKTAALNKNVDLVKRIAS